MWNIVYVIVERREKENETVKVDQYAVCGPSGSVRLFLREVRPPVRARKTSTTLIRIRSILYDGGNLTREIVDSSSNSTWNGDARSRARIVSVLSRVSDLACKVFRLNGEGFDFSGRLKETCYIALAGRVAPTSSDLQLTLCLFIHRQSKGVFTFDYICRRAR